MHEAHLHERNCFVTLTYSDDNLPTNNGLDPRHFTLFAKQLRNKMGKFRYLQCGEYGAKRQRPHFHAIIFGLDFHHDRTLYKHTRDGHALYNSPMLDSAWGNKGFCVIGNVSFQSAAYVARYILKKQKTNVDDPPAHYEKWDPETGEVTYQPEFATMSRNPGLGRDWYDKYGHTIHANDFVMHEGAKVPIPRYYDTLLGQRNPEQLAAIKERRKLKAALHPENTTPDRLAIREYILQARLSKLERELE